MNREQLFAAFFLALLLFLSYQFYLIVGAVIGPLAWAGLLALMFYPAQAALTSVLRGRDGLAAFILTTTVIAVVMVPTTLVITMLASETVELYRHTSELLARGELPHTIQELQLWIPERLRNLAEPYLNQIDFKSIALNGANVGSQFIAAQVAVVAKNIASFIANFFLATFALFFFFRDGHRMIQGVRDILPMSPEHKDLLFKHLSETLTAVVQGTLVTAAAQGLLAGLGYWALSVPFAVFLGCATALLALLPFGTPIAWGSVAVYLAVSGEWGRCLLMVIWGMAGVGTIDNFLRPLIIGSRTSIPTVMMFFGIIGGLQAYGILGIFLAPTVIAILIAFVRVYKEQYATAG